MWFTRAKLFAGLGVVAAVLAVILGATAFRPACVKGRTTQERIGSICRLADDRPRGAGEAIVAAARKDADPAVRRAAMIALGRFIEPKYRRVVVAGTVDDSAPVRAGAALTLGRYADEAAVRRLGRLMNSDEDEQVRLAAATGLGRARGRRSVGLLVLAVETSDSPRVRLQALRALEKRYNIVFSKLPGPQDRAGWETVVRTVRRLPGAKEAAESAAAPAQEE